MSTLNNVTTLEQLGQQFTGLFKRRVFRLETLDYYDAENEREPYARFLAGQPVDPAWREPWQALVREVRESGRVMERVQIVSEPVSDYVRFSLLHGKPASVKAGEDVRVLDRDKARTLADRPVFAPGLELPARDFWLFDDDLAALLDYTSRGTVKQVRMVRNPSIVAWCRYARTRALDLATPLSQYVAEHNITERKHAA